VEKETAPVKHALAVQNALATGNYHRFFKLYEANGPFRDKGKDVCFDDDVESVSRRGFDTSTSHL
jgi:hypothetical protein